jgi:zinc-ribbon domain
MEPAVIQSVHCPSCDTRYGLRRARVRPGIRRAQCFRCQTVFGVESEVLLLLGESHPEPWTPLEPLPSLPAAEPPSLPPEEPPAARPHALPEAELELPSLEELQEATAHLQAAPAPLEIEPMLSLEDLSGPDEETLDKTLVDYPAPSHPESRPTPPAMAAEPEAEEAGHSGYASAREAIAKLMGEAPPAAPYRPPSSRSGGAQMDVEATLSALEHTLGGVSAQGHPVVKPSVLDPIDFPPPAGATTKLSREEVAAAVAGLQPQAQAVAEPTLVLRAPPATPLPALATQPGMDPNLLKVQMGTELYSNLTMDQLTNLAEQGRLMEYHMVARQFSDNWLEAGKVPGLRPVFERLRRMRMPEPAPSPLETAPIKKSLFGGLFGKGNA